MARNTDNVAFTFAWIEAMEHADFVIAPILAQYQYPASINLHRAAALAVLVRDLIVQDHMSKDEIFDLMTTIIATCDEVGLPVQIRAHQ